MKIARLGVNIDHVATIRQARQSSYPSLTRAAQKSIFAGADQITIHLRFDRRHIQDNDVPTLVHYCHQHNSLLNLEVCCDPQIIHRAVYYAPDWVCLVPERQEERTTEGGLNLKDSAVYNSVKEAIKNFKQFSPTTKISLFLAPDIDLIPLLPPLDIQAVEVHTGDYAHRYPQHNHELHKIKSFLLQLKTLKIGLHAGHGLTNESIVPLLQQGIIEEYNIGHWIISESIFTGIEHVVRDLKQMILKYPLL